MGVVVPEVVLDCESEAVYVLLSLLVPEAEVVAVIVGVGVAVDVDVAVLLVEEDTLSVPLSVGEEVVVPVHEADPELDVVCEGELLVVAEAVTEAEVVTVVELESELVTEEVDVSVAEFVPVAE